MTKPVITTRAGKGSALTWTEGDANLTNLRDATISVTDGTNTAALDLNDTLTLTAGTNTTISVNSGTKTVTISSTGSGSGITDVVQDTTPQLGGNLDVNGNSIVSVSNGNIAITPNGTGSVIIDGNAMPQDQGEADQVLITDGAGQTSWSVTKTVHSLVYNADSVTITKGQPVYLFGANGANPSVKLAANAADGTSATTYGLANESIAAGATGNVVTQGLIKNVNTASYSAGDILYLGATAGTLTATKPYAPNHLVYLGVVTSVNSTSGRILVKVQNGYELDELHNVQITSTPSDGQVLAYETSSSLWKPRTNSLDGLSDVVITAAANGKLIQHNGTNWVDVTASSVTVGNADAATLAATATKANNLSGGNGTTLLGSIPYQSGTNTTSLLNPNTTTTNKFLTQVGDGTNGMAPMWSTISSLDNVTIGSITAAAGSFTTLTVKAGNDLRLSDSDSSNYVGFKAPTTVMVNKVWTLPDSDGTNGQYLKTDGAGNLSFGTVSVSPAGSNTQVQYNNSGSFGASANLTWNNSTNTLSATTFSGALTGTATKATNLVGGNGTTLLGSLPYQSGTDTTSLLSPNTTTTQKFLTQVGDGTNGMAPMWSTIASLNNVIIGSTTAAAGTFTDLTSTGKLTFKQPIEAIYDLGTTGGTIAPNAANGSVQKITLNSALTINAFTSPVAGQSLTLIIYGGTSYTSITSTMKFAGGIKTLTATAGCIDILSVYYDGTNYFASLGKGYA